MTTAPPRVVKGATTTTSVSSPEPKKHINWVVEGDVARGLGVQVRALCGFWVWPPDPGASVPGEAPTPNSCQRCSKGLAKAKRVGSLIR